MHRGTMVSKDELLDLLDDAVRQEEVIITAWRDAVLEKLPASGLTPEQKDRLKRIVDTQMAQSFVHKRIFTEWVNTVLGSDKDEF